MARQPRYNLPGQPQHVIIRGNNREPIFIADDDYHQYLELLEKAIKKYPCELHAYVLMTNHVHLLITPQAEGSLSKAIQSIGRGYVQYFNFKYQRTGTLWEGRYKATLIDCDTYALVCYRYIECNPVRAEMVDHPGEYPWSSFRCNALGEPCSFITAHTLYSELGSNTEQRSDNYRALFNAHIPIKTLREIREMTNKSWVLGDDHFRARIQAQLKRPVAPLPKGGDRRSSAYRKQGSAKPA